MGKAQKSKKWLQKDKNISVKCRHAARQSQSRKMFIKLKSLFAYLGKSPQKLMEYYLPTTVKLLEAYQQLGRQPVQGENIKNSKAEIEKALDTLNVAFEKLLDSLFEDVAWDVSSDISVLHTMLAQEGLTKDDFKYE